MTIAPKTVEKIEIEKRPPTRKRKAPVLKLQANPFLHEIFELACSQRTKDKKIEVLREHRYDGMMSVLIWNYVESLQSDLPPGDIPYAALQELNVGNDTLSDTIKKQIKTNQSLDSTSNNRTSIRNEHKNFYNFLVGGNITLSTVRRETMFINLLEGLHPKEAQILIYTKDKALESLYPLPFELIQEAFPDVQWVR